MYPARIEVPEPIRKAVAVYGKLVERLSLPISWESTVAPIMKAKIAEKIARYRYSLTKKEIAPSVIFPPMFSRASLISAAVELISLPTFSYSDLF
jgi:hypothetical protein